jgi:4a-hydroxytetrahydrobiopterin dehydratase
MSKVLSTKEVTKKLESLPGWSLRKPKIIRTFSFEEFIDGIDFVQKVSIIAQKANHHPDINIRFNKVTMSLTSHDSGGITSKDVTMAEKCDEIYFAMMNA